MQQLWLLHSARPLMLIDIHGKFCEDILNAVQVIEWTHFFVMDKYPTEIIKTV